MVLVPVLREALRQGLRTLTKYYALEGKAFDKLYTGFPRSRVVGRGVRHGLLAGQVAGSFINTADDTPGNGIQTPYRKQSKARPAYKTRRRKSVYNRSRCAQRYRTRRGYRYSQSRRY